MINLPALILGIVFCILSVAFVVYFRKVANSIDFKKAKKIKTGLDEAKGGVR